MKELCFGRGFITYLSKSAYGFPRLDDTGISWIKGEKQKAWVEVVCERKGR